MLEVGLTHEQINAACCLHKQLALWCAAEAALDRLRGVFPGFDIQSCLVKTAALNSLYGTNVFAVTRMAAHVEGLMCVPGRVVQDVSLVEAIARPRGMNRCFLSFASKFCHFFLDKGRFPIYDSAARWALRLHLGTQVPGENSDWTYTVYCDAFWRLVSAVGTAVSTREMDHYLWMIGMHRLLRKHPEKVNRELRDAFRNRDNRPVLRTLLPKLMSGEVKVSSADRRARRFF